MDIRVIIFLYVLIVVEGVRYNSRSTKKELQPKLGRSRRGDLDNIFDVYNPTFLAVLWPKITNGMHLTIGQRCWDDMSIFFKDFVDARAWTYRLVDASGRYQSGFFGGSRFWLGSKEQCLHLDNNFVMKGTNDTLNELHGDYINALRKEKNFDGAEEWSSLVQQNELMQQVVLADNRPAYRVAYSVLSLMLNITKFTMIKSYDITMGLCLPRSCTTNDVESLISFSIIVNDNLKSNKTVPRSVKIMSVKRIDNFYNIKSDTGTLLLIIVTVLIFVLAITATVMDLDLVKYRIQNPKSMSFDLQKYASKETKDRKAEINSKEHTCEFLSKKESNVSGLETLIINNTNNSNNINLATMKKTIKPNTMPPSITLGVVSTDRATGSCRRCGKYKKQCSNLKPVENLPACPRIKYNSFASLSTNDKRNRFFRTLLLSFSLNYSWKRIFNPNMANKDLSMIHGLKIFATFWIIYIQVATVVSYISDNSGDINENNNMYYILNTGTLAFDTLFFASGLFSAHHFFYLKSRYTVEELVSFGGNVGHMLQFICFVTNRAVRLLPSYLYTILLSSTLARVSQVTSSLTVPERDYDNCDAYWWRNLLYISTFYPRDERCMQISWYLSTETQLHLITTLLCAVWGSRRCVAASLAIAAVLAATTADVSEAYSDYGLYLNSAFDAYVVFIERPWARVSPYFIGVLTGWLVHRMDGELNSSKVTSCCLWAVSVLTALATCAMPWLIRSWITAWLHAAWPTALLWPALVCAIKYAGMTRRLLDRCNMAALSRLSYSMILLHGVIARSLLLATDSALCSHTLCIWFYFTGVTVVTIVASLLLSLLVEMPCCSLLRRLSDCANT